MQLTMTPDFARFYAAHGHQLVVGGEGYLAGVSKKNQAGVEKIGVFGLDQLSVPKKIACGINHVFILYGSGRYFSLFAAGKNSHGQLAMSGIDEISAFTKMNYNNINTINDIYCGDNCTFLVCGNGDVFAAGDNAGGMLGVGSPADKITSFTKVESLSDAKNPVKKLFFRKGHIVAFLKEGDIYIAGSCQGVAKYYGFENQNLKFNKLNFNGPNEESIVDLSVGDFFMAVTTKNNKVYTIGCNVVGQLARQTENNNPDTKFALVAGLPPGLKIKQVVCAYSRMLVSTENTVFSAGAFGPFYKFPFNMSEVQLTNGMINTTGKLKQVTDLPNGPDDLIEKIVITPFIVAVIFRGGVLYTSGERSVDEYRLERRTTRISGCFQKVELELKAVSSIHDIVFLKYQTILLTSNGELQGGRSGNNVRFFNKTGNIVVANNGDASLGIKKIIDLAPSSRSLGPSDILPMNRCH